LQVGLYLNSKFQNPAHQLQIGFCCPFAVPEHPCGEFPFLLELAHASVDVPLSGLGCAIFKLLFIHSTYYTLAPGSES